MIEYQDPTFLGLTLGTIFTVFLALVIVSMIFMAVAPGTILMLIGYVGALIGFLALGGAGVVQVIENNQTRASIEDAYGVTLDADSKQINIPDSGDFTLYEDTPYEDSILPVVRLERSDDNMLTLYVPAERVEGTGVEEWVELTPAES